ncbi:MAG: adenylosuccinate lyase [Chitinophagales bacterium]
MYMNTLTAISPIDGRYRQKTVDLSHYFSEFALIGYRIMVEVEYFIALCKLPLPQLEHVTEEHFEQLRSVYETFDIEQAEEIKATEKVTNHDVKAVEYFIKNHLQNIGLEDFKEFVHFGLTSQDINNTAVPLLLRDAFHEQYLPLIEKIIDQIAGFARTWAGVPMLSRTHGQAASPTLVGKEMLVFWDRLATQYDELIDSPFTAKFGGAVGNFNAHHVAYPTIDWAKFGDEFLEHLGLERQQHTTQIEQYDQMAALFDGMKRINTILIDFCRDIWTYISMDYFKQKIKAGEVGSSTMPHKVNPIDFENAEGNLGMANAIFEHLSRKLPISRLQRDLTDSTVSRNIGVPFAHTLIALKSLEKGMNKLLLNESAIKNDLNEHWEVVTEAIQTILRRERYPNPYEALKQLSRTGEKITKESLHTFIDTLEISETVKTELKQITPFNYTGKFVMNVETAVAETEVVEAVLQD